MKKQIYYDYYFKNNDNAFDTFDSKRTIQRLLENCGLKETLEEAKEYLESYKVCEVECYKIDEDFVLLQEVGYEHFNKILINDVDLAKTHEECLQRIQKLADSYANDIKKLYQQTLDKIEIKIFDK